MGCTLRPRYRKAVGLVPYSLGLYNVAYKDSVHGEVNLEDMEYTNAVGGNTLLQTRIIMQVKQALGLKQWIEFEDLEFKRLRDSDVASGCACECYACDQMSLHCRNRTRECYI